ncbi:hypothetical protein FJZ39_03450 [Candidatus Saccharibacteria bacterium]|nr:hypothetical protein [Candidatus Saccharibacteria bacterium]
MKQASEPQPQQQNTQPHTPAPAGYDLQGRPLYYHPPAVEGERSEQPSEQKQGNAQMIAENPSHVSAPQSMHAGENFDPRLRSQYANEPAVVHAARPHEPDEFELSDKVKRRHEESLQQYPFLNLSRGEYVIMNIQRHPIGLFIPIAITVSLAALFIVLAGIILFSTDIFGFGISNVGSLFLPLLMFLVLIGLGGYIAVWVYLQNQFFMTNESVIQEIQHSLFSRHEQTVSLGSIEDASFTIIGPVQSLLNYGSIRLSTEGEETTYRFHYVTKPKQAVAILNDAIEAFKNGRPVTDEIVAHHRKDK